MTLTGRHVVLGVSGGIASYKACTLARRLVERGATLDVVMTAGAQEFVRAATFEALTQRPVLTSLWEGGRALAHVTLARADLVVVAPATAHLLARAAQGLADDTLTSLLLARSGPVLAAPAMNDHMYAHPATQENLATLKRRGWRLVGPVAGDLAEGPSDQPGRMVEPEDIADEVTRLVRARHSALAGTRVLVTAGPTREPLDAVRVISNRSSGRMGYALARAAWLRGADVTLISGPTALPVPHGPDVVRVETTADLAGAVRAHLPQADCLVMAAAPADFRPAETMAGKRERKGDLALALAATPDVLAETRSARKRGATMVGFAYESEPGVERARGKLKAKGLDLIVVNYTGDPDAGAEVDTNRVTLVSDRDETALPLLSKEQVAERILDAIETMR